MLRRRQTPDKTGPGQRDAKIQLASSQTRNVNLIVIKRRARNTFVHSPGIQIPQQLDHSGAYRQTLKITWERNRSNVPGYRLSINFIFRTTCVMYFTVSANVATDHERRISAAATTLGLLPTLQIRRGPGAVLPVAGSFQKAKGRQLSEDLAPCHGRARVHGAGSYVHLMQHNNLIRARREG